MIGNRMQAIAAISYGAAKLWAIPVTLLALAVVGGLFFAGSRRMAATLRKRAQRAADEAERAQLNARADELESTKGRSRASILLGADGRLSTSKTVAAAWTAVVAYVLITLLFSWPKDWADALKHLSPTYLLLLGGPYASLVLS